MLVMALVASAIGAVNAARLEQYRRQADLVISSDGGGLHQALWSSAIFGANIRLGIIFRRRAEFFITPRPVCSVSLSSVALQPHWGRFW